MATLTPNAQTLLGKRYSQVFSNNGFKTRENWSEVCSRVSRALTDDRDWQGKYFNLMFDLKFLPNSPTLMNAGRNGTLSACFTFVPEDSMESIMDVHRMAGMVLKYGGGVGYGISRLRPKGAPVAGTGGKARGPVATLDIYQSLAAFVEQAGKRDGAQMAILSVDHPDIDDFIEMKDKDPQRWNTFNISVAIPDWWMEEALYKAGSARQRLQKIARSAHKTGDPGMYFIDRAERDNPTPHLGKLQSTNPCGEVPLLHAEACNLGSFNLAAYSDSSWEKFGEDIKTAVRMLDDVVTVNKFPDPLIETAVTATRKIGIGVMGWADCLALRGIPYDSKKATQEARHLAKFMRETADDASEELAKFREPYPSWDGQGRAFRNATRLCIAPTGSIAILAGCSSGIEPHFELEYIRTMGDGTQLPTVEPVVERLREKNLPMPKTAMEIQWPDHVAMQAAWQDHVDLAVSKTINLPNDATEEQVFDIYVDAWKQGCKGVTIYRDQSRREIYGDNEKGGQVLQVSMSNEPEPNFNFPNGSPEPKSDLASPFTKAVESLGKAELINPSKTDRSRLPSHRDACTHKFEVGGSEGYITFGKYEDGSLGEVFVTLNKSGSAARGWADLTATFISMLLQYGVSVETITAKLRDTRFDPSGFTINPEIPNATSIPDYLGHVMEQEFLGIKAPALTPVEGGSGEGDFCTDCGALARRQEGCLYCSCGWSRC